MAREQVGTAPVRDDDTATVAWVRDQITAGISTITGRVVREQPAGVQDGENRTFTTANAFVPGSTEVYTNGLLEAQDMTYVEQPPDTLVFSLAPLGTDDIAVSYQRQG